MTGTDRLKSLEEENRLLKLSNDMHRQQLSAYTSLLSENLKLKVSTKLLTDTCDALLSDLEAMDAETLIQFEAIKKLHLESSYTDNTLLSQTADVLSCYARADNWEVDTLTGGYIFNSAGVTPNTIAVECLRVLQKHKPGIVVFSSIDGAN